MKTKKWMLILTMLSMIIMTSCEDKTVRTDLSSDESNATISRETLNEIAKTLAADRTWLDVETVGRLKEGAVKLNSLSSNTVLAKTKQYSQPIEVELYGNSNVNALAKGIGASPFYVGLDPDVYNFPQGVEEELTGVPVINEPVFYIDGGMVTETVVQLDPQNPTDKIIFFIKQGATASPSLTKTVTIAGTYLGFKQIKLLNKQDSSTEEFEVFFSADDVVSNITGSTGHIFDGNSHPDAAGQSRTYVDINEKATYQQPAVPVDETIAMARVDNLTYNLRMVAIEADQYGSSYVHGKYNRNATIGTVVYTNTDFYDMADATKRTDSQGYYVGLVDNLNDDRYQHGGIKNINQTNLNLRTNTGAQAFVTSGIGLTDMDWTMVRLVVN